MIVIELTTPMWNAKNNSSKAQKVMIGIKLKSVNFI